MGITLKYLKSKFSLRNLVISSFIQTKLLHYKIYMKTLLIICLLFISFTQFGQISVGSNGKFKKNPGKLNQSDLQRLSNTKTIFVYREIDKRNLTLFKTTLAYAWTYTELEFMSYEEFAIKSFGEEYSFITIGGTHKYDALRSSNTSLQETHVYLNLWLNKGEEKVLFCRIELFPAFESLLEISGGVKTNAESIYYLYKSAKIYNWNTTYIQTALKLVNKRLSESKKLSFMKKKTDVNLKNLRNDTLYIPNYILTKFKASTGNESERHNINDLMKKYNFNYKVVSASRLYDKFISNSEHTYFLSYVKSSSSKFVCVLDAKNGELVYSRFKEIAYNIKPKDIRKISNAIKRKNKELD